MIENILILSVGGSPEPLIFSINKFNPDRIIFLHTPQTFKEIDKIIKETKYSKNIASFEITDPESLDESFAVSKKVFSSFSDSNSYEVTVDFTGGTKPMVSGIVLAVVEGNYSNFKFSYVGSKDSESRNKNGVGIVKDGSEITKMQINPYKKYAITEFKRGKSFFNSYQFEAARENFTCAKRRLEHDENQVNLAVIYRKLVKFYQIWDKFYDKKSRSLDLYDYLTDINNKIKGNKYNYDSFNGTDFYIQLNNNLKFLSLKMRGVEMEDEDNSESALLKNRIKYYLPDLINNARRRIDEAKYDDAVARLYRVNELIAQIKLCEYDLILENRLQAQKEFVISVDKIKQKARGQTNETAIGAFIERNSNKKDLNKGILRLSNDRSYELLEFFDFEKEEKFDELNTALKVRNNSILAHGLNPISEEKAIALFEKTVVYASSYFEDLEDLMELAKFPKFEI